MKQAATEIKISFFRQIFGLLSLLISVIIFISLISFNIDDYLVVSFDLSSSSNLIGLAGDFLAYSLFYAIGYSSYIICFLMLIIGINLTFIKEHKLNYSFATGFLLSILFTCLLVQNTVTIDMAKHYGYLPAGSLGNFLANVLNNYLSSLAQIIIAIFMLIIATMLITQSSLTTILQSIKKLFLLNWQLILAVYQITAKINKLVYKQISKFLKYLSVNCRKAYISFNSQNSTALVVDDIEQQPELKIKKIVRDTKAINVKSTQYNLPPLDLLDNKNDTVVPVEQKKLQSQAGKLIQIFKEFNIDGTIKEVRPGPIVTTFEFVPSAGIKIAKVSALADDIAMSMHATHIRIVAPIPGKGAVGIEIPNDKRATVHIKDIVADRLFLKNHNLLYMAIGKDIEGRPYYADLAEMPHILVAGSTGSGKSVSINAMICSILYRATAKQVRFLMIDPKMLELNIYNGIPHLLLPPIIDAKKAAAALRWAINEMENRYKLMSELGVRDIKGYNNQVKLKNDENLQHMPSIVIVIDEYADLLAVAGKEVEMLIMRLAQKARACGIHMILATQRPSVDVVTGLIKANFPVRIGFRLASSHDSKTIVNKYGAERLLGNGDMLIMPSGSCDLVRVHGAYISETELSKVINFLKKQKSNYDMSIASEQSTDEIYDNTSSSDEKYLQAVKIVKMTKKCSTSWLQRQLAIGYNRAARLVEEMEKNNIVGPIKNNKGDRDILVE